MLEIISSFQFSKENICCYSLIKVDMNYKIYNGTNIKWFDGEDLKNIRTQAVPDLQSMHHTCDSLQIIVY